MGKLMSKVGPSMLSTNDKPLVVVLGATGAGKSKLSLDIARHVDGEIINADAMQMYKGLDIVTNKVTPDELKICRHHIIGFLSPRDQFTVVDFQQHALKAIEEIHQRNKVPILVGGTNYYVEAVLWDFLIQCKGSNQDLIQSVDEIRKDLYQLSCTELYKRLKEVDPHLASTTHPKDKRKVVRGLEVYYQTGKPMSEHIATQRQQPGGSCIGGPLRFPGSCVLWVQCEADILEERIEKRVDKMIESGLLQELSDFHKAFNKVRLEEGLEVDYHHGIFQSIGFKEFHNYLTTPTPSEDKKQKMLFQSIERMKISTWQYAKWQTKWIKKRIVNRSNTVPVFALDGSDPDHWEERVLTPALQILFSFYSSNSAVGPRLRDVISKDSLVILLNNEKPNVRDIRSSSYEPIGAEGPSFYHPRAIFSQTTLRSYWRAAILWSRRPRHADLASFGSIMSDAGGKERSWELRGRQSVEELPCLQWEVDTVEQLGRYFMFAHVKSKNHKRLFGMMKKQQDETIAILNAREVQLKNEENQTCPHDKQLRVHGSNKT